MNTRYKLTTDIQIWMSLFRKWRIATKKEWEWVWLIIDMWWFEEVVEKDWIEKAHILYKQDDMWTLDSFRHCVNMTLPRITDDMIMNIVKWINDYNIDNDLSLKWLIKQNLPKDLLANPE